MELYDTSCASAPPHANIANARPNPNFVILVRIAGFMFFSPRGFRFGRRSRVAADFIRSTMRFKRGRSSSGKNALFSDASRIVKTNSARSAFRKIRETDRRRIFAASPKPGDPTRPVSFDNSEQSLDAVPSVQLGRRTRAEHPQLTDGEVRTPLLRLFFGSSQTCHAITFTSQPGKLPVLR